MFRDSGANIAGKQSVGTGAPDAYDLSGGLRLKSQIGTLVPVLALRDAPGLAGTFSLRHRNMR
jgi:hypothetical protein